MIKGFISKSINMPGEIVERPVLVTPCATYIWYKGAWRMRPDPAGGLSSGDIYNLYRNERALFHKAYHATTSKPLIHARLGIDPIHYARHKLDPGYYERARSWHK